MRHPHTTVLVGALLICAGCVSSPPQDGVPTRPFLYFDSDHEPLPVYGGHDPRLQEECDKMRASEAYRRQKGWTCAEGSP